MVYNYAQFRMPASQLQHLLQMARKGIGNIQRQSGFGHHFERLLHLGSQDELRIFFIVDQMPYSFQDA